ncbi:MAG: hypothetical protein LJE67_13965, partial [Salaquimonas sp.]|nr:hypothetical protein [Salaquimonas sp.]
MKLPVFGSTKEGAYISLITLPVPWPPHKPLITKLNLKDGVFRLTVGYGRRIVAEVIRIDGDTEMPIQKITTCRIAAEPGAIAIVSARWSDYVDIRINGRTVASTRSPEDVPRLYRIDAFPYSNGDMDDLSERNAKAIVKRQRRYQSYIPKPNTKDGGEAYVLESLAEEAAQIDDLVKFVKEGKYQHTRGLAGRLRLLLYKGGRQEPLLQAGAA